MIIEYVRIYLLIYIIVLLHNLIHLNKMGMLMLEIMIILINLLLI